MQNSYTTFKKDVAFLVMTLVFSTILHTSVHIVFLSVETFSTSYQFFCNCYSRCSNQYAVHWQQIHLYVAFQQTLPEKLGIKLDIHFFSCLLSFASGFFILYCKLPKTMNFPLPCLHILNYAMEIDLKKWMRTYFSCFLETVLCNFIL